MKPATRELLRRQRAREVEATRALAVLAGTAVERPGAEECDCEVCDPAPAWLDEQGDSDGDPENQPSRAPMRR